MWLNSESAQKAEILITECLDVSADAHNIFTPFSLCKEVVNKIPSLDGKILVVANIEFIYTLLQEGVDRTNIYFATPCNEKASVASLLIDNNNIFVCTGVLDNEGLQNMKFDVVVGNPPYQNEKAANGRKTATKPLWFYFVNVAFDITKNDGFVAFITPVAWIQYTSNINKTITSHVIKWVKLFSVNPFKGVGITPSCWIAQNTPNTSDSMDITIDDNSHTLKLNKDFIPTTPDAFGVKFSVLNKTVNSNNIKLNIQATQEHHTGSKAHQLQDTEDGIFKYPVFHTNTQRKWSSIKGSLHGKSKVVISKTGSINGAHVSVESSVSQIGMALLTESIAEADIALLLLHSKLYKFLVHITRSNSTVPSQLWRSLPAVDLSRSWTDEELYQHFNLTNEEIQLIEETIK